MMGLVPSFAVRYRSRGQVLEVRWRDGCLSAEPLVSTVIETMRRDGSSLDEIEAAARTVLDALYEVGAHIIGWEGDVTGLGPSPSGNEPSQ
jgi:hypothetical protein